MKARHIRKLRKRLQEYQTYRVIPNTGICGMFYVNNAYVVKASGCIHAIERYMKYYWRKYKCRSQYYSERYIEGNFYHGNLCVIDEKGYQRYYL